MVCLPLLDSSFAGDKLFYDSLNDFCDLDTIRLRIFHRENLSSASIWDEALEP